MKHLRILAFAATAMLASSTWASAQEAYTTGDVNMRAGPGSRYPVVTTIPEDRQVFIHGCLSDWDWCDVSWRRNRGWVFSDYLEALYRNRRVAFDEYRTFVDIPFVSFGVTYWDRYYRDRPWYGDWDHWGDRHDRRYRRDRDHERDWNRDGDNTRDGDVNRDREWNRTDMQNRDNRDEDEATIRRDRRPGERRGQRCAPDDPNCGDGGNDQPDQMGQP